MRLVVVMRLGFSLLVLLLAKTEAHSTTTTTTKILSGSNKQQQPPRFGDPVQNLTVAVGREAVFSCVVLNLKEHQVAWFHKEQHTLLSLQDKVITKNSRIGISAQGTSTFSLHIRDVREDDAGTYSCQVNTAPMMSQSGQLQVVVPARFVEHLTSSDLEAQEDSNVSLRCLAKGSPMPEIKWRREDGQSINMQSGEKVTSVVGDFLNLTKVQRLDSGAYHCIASNGIPPAISKRIFVGVTFSPMIWTPEPHAVGAAQGSDVSLECILESYPQPVTFWSKANGPQIIASTSSKYDSEVINVPNTLYKSVMKLRIKNLLRSDFGSYECVAKNAQGETRGAIRVYESAKQAASTPGSRSSSNPSRIESDSISRQGKYPHRVAKAGPNRGILNKGAKNSGQRSGTTLNVLTEEEKSTLTSLLSQNGASSPWLHHQTTLILHLLLLSFLFFTD